MDKVKPLPITLVNIIEINIAVVIGFLFRELIDYLALVFSIKVQPVWIVVILGIPLMLILLKAHFIVRGWLVKTGWLAR
jgi:hypothetical protein